MQRAIHLVTAVPILAYAYATPDAGAPLTLLVRWAAVPVLVATGMLMWQGPRLRRMRARRRAAR